MQEKYGRLIRYRGKGAIKDNVCARCWLRNTNLCRYAPCMGGYFVGPETAKKIRKAGPAYVYWRGTVKRPDHLPSGCEFTGAEGVWLKEDDPPSEWVRLHRRWPKPAASKYELLLTKLGQGAYMHGDELIINTQRLNKVDKRLILRLGLK